MMNSALYWYIRRQFPDVNQIKTSDLDEAQKITDHGETENASPVPENETKRAYVIVDCRREDEFDVSHIPKANHLPFQTDDESIIRFIKEEKDKQSHLNASADELNLVCYCSLGYRSSLLAQRITNIVKNDPELSSKGVNAWNLEGSIFKWANEKRPLVDMYEKSTKFAHPFNLTFGMFLQSEYRKWEPDKKEDLQNK